MVASTAKEISSPFLAPRRSSSYSGVSISSNDNALETSTSINDVEPEHKSTLIGCTANLITAIVGAGIIGMLLFCDHHMLLELIEHIICTFLLPSMTSSEALHNAASLLLYI